MDQNIQKIFFGLYRESLYTCLNVFIPLHSTETMPFTADIEMCLMTAVNQGA